jgi:hypothetical protein
VDEAHPAALEGQAVDLEHELALALAGDTELRVPFGPGSVLPDGVVRAFDAGLLLGAPGLGLAPQPLELLAEEVLAVAFRALGVGLALGARFEVGRIAARVAGHHALVELERPGRDPVEHIAVVGDEEQGTAEARAEVVLEPLDGLDVEVVGGLVEDGEGR